MMKTGESFPSKKVHLQISVNDRAEVFSSYRQEVAYCFYTQLHGLCYLTYVFVEYKQLHHFFLLSRQTPDSALSRCFKFSIFES